MFFVEKPTAHVGNRTTIFPVQGVLVHPRYTTGDWHSDALSHYNIQKTNRTGKWLF